MIKNLERYIQKKKEKISWFFSQEGIVHLTQKHGGGTYSILFENRKKYLNWKLYRGIGGFLVGRGARILERSHKYIKSTEWKGS